MDPQQVRRLARIRKCSCVECFYCGASMDDRHEHDHFPVPRVAKGTAVVSTCLDCHDLKDRIPVANWPIEAFVEAMQGLIADIIPGGTGSETADDLTTGTSSVRFLGDAVILGRWATVPALSRILYGKIRGLEEERRFHEGRRVVVAPGASSLQDFTNRYFDKGRDK
jgi:hypothetical protein